MDRRSFLRSLVATAVAAALPDIPVAQADSLQDSIADKLASIRINGAEVRSITVSAVGNGWVRVTAAFVGKEDGTMTLDFSRMNDGMGLAVFSPELADGYLREYPSHIVAHTVSAVPQPTTELPWNATPGRSYTFSMFVRAGDHGVVVKGPQVEEQARTPTSSTHNLPLTYQRGSHNLLPHSGKFKVKS